MPRAVVDFPEGRRVFKRGFAAAELDCPAAVLPGENLPAGFPERPVGGDRRALNRAGSAFDPERDGEIPVAGERRLDAHRAALSGCGTEVQSPAADAVGERAFELVAQRPRLVGRHGAGVRFAVERLPPLGAVQSRRRAAQGGGPSSRMIHGFFLYIVSVPIKYHDSRLNSTPAARKYFAACGRRKFPPCRENSARTCDGIYRWLHRREMEPALFRILRSSGCLLVFRFSFSRLSSLRIPEKTSAGNAIPSKNFFGCKTAAIQPVKK